MVNEEMFAVKEHEFDLQVELFKREKEIRDKVEIAEVFGRMKEQILIATNLIGILEPDMISQVTGVSLAHIKAISGNN